MRRGRRSGGEDEERPWWQSMDDRGIYRGLPGHDRHDRVRAAFHVRYNEI